MSGFIGRIEYFNTGDNFNSYIERLNHLLKLNKITTDDDKVSFLIGVGGGDLYNISKTLVAPKKPDDLKYDELVQKLVAHFEPKKNITAERYKFLNRNQELDESVSDFIVAIKQLAEGCKYLEFLNEALKDRLLMGLKNKRIQSKLIDADELTWEKACEIALNMELIETEMANMSGGSAVAVNSVRKKRSDGDRDSRSTTVRPLGEHAVRGNSRSRMRNFDKLQCHFCKKWGHTQKYCYMKNRNNSYFRNRSKSRNRNNSYNAQRNKISAVNDSDVEENSGLGYLNNVIYDNSSALFIHVICNGKQLKMEIDSGACTSVMHISTWKSLYPNTEIKEYNRNLNVISGGKVDIVGCAMVKVKLTLEGDEFELELVVIGGPKVFIPLLGRSWLDRIVPLWRDKIVSGNKLIAKVEVTQKCVTDLFTKYPNFFKGEKTVAIQRFKANILLDENTVPVFCKPYSLPFGVKDRVKKELDRLVAENIIYPVKYSNWASPIVAVEKPSGEVRLCVDCKGTINPYVRTNHYPLPKSEDIFVAMAGCAVFSVLDLEGAYQQVEVEDSCQEFLTINTDWGLFRYRRLIFGVKCASAIFQDIMDKILNGLSKVKCYIDDIIIGGANFDECKNNLRKVLERLNEFKVRVKYEKCRFYKNEIDYLGHIISEDGIKPSTKNLEAIKNAPQPQNLTQLKSYLGLLNYYSRFIPNLSTELRSLYELTKKEVAFEWSSKCEEAFIRSKTLILQNNILAHYDPSKEIVLHCDASPYGVGGILSHIINGIERPVLFASSTLSSSEQNYSQLHKEALAIIFTVKKFHKYIYGRTFTIYSDHQPLREIFNPKKSTPAVAAARIHRWAVFLSTYQYKIEYKKGSQMSNADGLSRLPLLYATGLENDSIKAIRSTNYMNINFEDVRQETERDWELKSVLSMIQNGFPSLVQHNLKIYVQKKFSLSREGGCLFYGERLIIPRTLRDSILTLLHDTHIGVVRMKMLARQYFWWPGIDGDIESHVFNCKACVYSSNKPVSSHHQPWPESNSFFERVLPKCVHSFDSNCSRQNLKEPNTKPSSSSSYHHYPPYRRRHSHRH
ncbi:uncharacterized protein K02A2.6-like [Eupeodes corollae]|uniref:uncharacterized protein K02A2.6-like n=1 Tax=Eupeodes corollae TaxID=290404 RepID=UPI002493483F|nr:uncharacterized protein K02A2.6-like [Eupeodes corollae]